MDEEKIKASVKTPEGAFKVTETELNLSNPSCTIRGIRLNLGAGSDYKEDFLNVDMFDKRCDANWDCRKLPLNDCSVAQIIAYEVVEHIGIHDVLPMLKEWNRVLKPGGKIMCTVPDIVGACKKVVESPEDEWPLAPIYGNQSHEGQFHKSGYTPKRIVSLLGYAGFRTVETAYFEYGGNPNIYFSAAK